MKKQFISILAMLSCFAFMGGCLKDNAADKDSTPGNSITSEVPGEGAVVNFKAVKAILKGMYDQDVYSYNNVDFEVTNVIPDVQGTDYTLTWSVDVDSVKLERNGDVTKVNVDEASPVDVDYVLTATITAPNGESDTQNFRFTVKAVSQYVTATITGKPLENTPYKFHLYQSSLQQDMYFAGAMDGYYFKTTTESSEAVDLYAEYVEGSETNFNLYFKKDVVDAVSGETQKDVKHYIGMRVSADGGHNNIVFDTAGPVSEFYWSDTYKTIITMLDEDRDGNKNVEFYLGNYGTLKTISGSVASQHYGKDGNNVGNLVGLVDRTTVPAADKVANTIQTLGLKNSYQCDTEVELPERGAMYPEVLISWACDSELVTIEGGKMTFANVTDATEVVLKATVTCGDVSETKDVTITIASALPADGSTLTIPQALEIGKNLTADTTQKYYVSGTITGFYTNGTTYGNVYIKDAEGNEILIYGLYSEDGSVRYDKMETKPVEGDFIKVYGVLTQYNGKAQFKNTWLMEHVVGEGGGEGGEEGGDVEKPESAEEILKALYALADGESLTGPFTITGKITALDTYNNPTIVVEGFENMPVYCYRLKVTNAVGDTITVTAGSMKNYQGTYEFMDCTLVSSEVGGGDEGGEEGGDVEKPESAEEILKALYALADGESLTGPFTITGKITALDNYSNPTIVVEGFENMPVYCYKLVVSNAVGDTITVTAGSMKNYQGKYEFMDCTLVSSEVGGGDEGGEVTPPEGGEGGEGETHEHSGYAEDYKCDECSAVVEPEADTTLTLAQAIKLADALGAGNYSTNSYYLTCEIVNIYNTQYGNANVTDADGTDYVLYGLYLDGVRYDKLTYKPVTGDTITVYGPVGSYNATSYQMKDAEITEIVAHEHDYQDVVTAPTCTADGYTTHTCSICENTYTDSEVAALGHNYVEGKCSVCDAVEGAQPVVSTLATFDFGANGNAAHVDGNDLGASKTYTVGSYSLALTDMSKVYGVAYDATGNSCIKLGTSKVVGTFTFTVPENVTEVVIYVAKYKANTTKIAVNGTNYTLTNSSNDGKYDEIKVDTTTTKTITFTTVSGGVRAMVNTIIFNGLA